MCDRCDHSVARGNSWIIPILLFSVLLDSLMLLITFNFLFIQ